MKRNVKQKKVHLENVDIREVLDEIEVFYTEHGKNVSYGWIGTECPWCDDSSNHLGICLASPVVSCFKCGKKGNYISFISEILGSMGKALEVLQSNCPRELKTCIYDRKSRASHVSLPKNAKKNPSKYHAGYLNYRNFNYQDLCGLYNLHFVGPVGDWKNRIIVPILRNYRLVTFTSIDISDETFIRYKHLSIEESIYHAKEVLFGIEHTNKQVCVLVEGLMDMFRIGPGCVCAFGTKVTSDQKKILSQFGKVVIAFDGDDAGRENADTLASDLCIFTDVEVLDLPEGDDPDKLCPDDVKFIRSKIGK